MEDMQTTTGMPTTRKLSGAPKKKAVVYPIYPIYEDNETYVAYGADYWDTWTRGEAIKKEMVAYKDKNS